MDLHTHTDYSSGRNTLYSMAKKVMSLGHKVYISTDNEETMNEHLYMRQMFESRLLMKEGLINIPIINGLQIKSMPKLMNGLLFGEEAILKYLTERPSTIIDFFKNMEYGLVICHPVLSNIDTLLNDELFTKLIAQSHGIEVKDNLGTYVTESQLTKLDDIKVLKRIIVTDAHAANEMRAINIDHNVVDECSLIRYLKEELFNLSNW